MQYGNKGHVKTPSALAGYVATDWLPKTGAGRHDRTLADGTHDLDQDCCLTIELTASPRGPPSMVLIAIDGTGPDSEYDPRRRQVRQSYLTSGV